MVEIIYLKIEKGTPGARGESWDEYSASLDKAFSDEKEVYYGNILNEAVGELIIKNKGKINLGGLVLLIEKEFEE